MFEASYLPLVRASIGPDGVRTVCEGFAVPAVLDFT